MFDAGTTLRLSQMINLGFAGYNLFGTGSSPTEMPRAAGGGVSLKPLPMLMLDFDMRWLFDNGPMQLHGARYGGGAELFLRTGGGQSGFPIRVGALRDNALDATYLSAGLGITTLGFGVDVGGRKAISGPNETMNHREHPPVRTAHRPERRVARLPRRK